MIEVVISPAHIPAGSDADLNIRLTNVGQGTCTNVILSVRLPATIMRLGGRNKIEAARLGPGESVTLPLRVRATRQGRFQLTSPNFSYRDHRGTVQRVRSFTTDITVDPEKAPEADPHLIVDLRTAELPLSEWSILRGRISNVGESDASNLEITLSGRVTVDDHGRRFPVEQLPAGGSVDATFHVRAQEPGAHVPVYLDLAYSGPNRRHRDRAPLTVQVSAGPAPDQNISSSARRSLAKILFIGANPRDTHRLRIDEEIREIQQIIRLSTERDRFQIHTQPAARARDIGQALLDIEPSFVHFAGHGGGKEGSFVAEDESGQPHIIPVEGLVKLFDAAGQSVECIIVNACSTERLARGLSSAIPYVIGMRQPVGDQAAITFSVGFYQALGAGRPIELAFDVGVAQMMMHGDDPSPPLLLSPQGSKPADQHPESNADRRLAATAWDDADWQNDQARGWTVMRTLRRRREVQLEEAAAARQRLTRREETFRYITPALNQQQYEDEIKARWSGGPTVLAFLFAPPGSDTIAMLDARGGYFDVRTGDTWDLFFPGYYRSAEDADLESQAGARPIGRSHADNWYFSPRDFNGLRRHIENSSNRRWEYSGGVDLILINAWLPGQGELTIDWASTISGQITDLAAGIHTLTLGNVIERITRDLETAAEDSSYGVGEVTEDQPSPVSHVGRDFMIQALSGIAAALGAKALGG